jgi:hypothetical protein
MRRIETGAGWPLASKEVLEWAAENAVAAGENVAEGFHPNELKDMIRQAKN